MSVQERTYYLLTCDRDGCNRDSSAQGATAAFPTAEAACEDWVRHGGSLDPTTNQTFCNWHPHNEDDETAVEAGAA
jgi:hypothetical protein